eukprot:GGOE01018458.1.p1 GENE.GGOE01018458.1~~GGOE01018458.1.p1  ORF type:complete len:415 (+),score=76.59 GGOE01018458.1:34-1278(+)
MVDARFLSRTLVGLGLLAMLSMLFSPFGPSCETEQDPGLDLLLQDLQAVKAQARSLLTDVVELRRRRKAFPSLPPKNAAKGGVPQPPRSPTTEEPETSPSLASLPIEMTEKESAKYSTDASPKATLSDSAPQAPLPITRQEALRRVRQQPECLTVIEQNWPANNSFTSQYSQDWFLFVNYFHHLEKGFYLDIGANEPKSLSNTWFLDVCLGWDGICVEADPGLGQLLRQQRSCKVVSTCVDSSNRTLALQAAGIAVGHMVPLKEKNERGKVLQCVTLAQIVREHHVRHIDFFSLDVEDHEMHVLQTMPEEAEGLTIDVILIENEKTSRRIGRCHNPDLLRYPFWLRGYGLVGFHGLPQGDDLWVKLDRPHLWRRHIEYARAHPQMERTRLIAYKTLLPEIHRNPAVLDKFTKRL